MGPAIDAYGIEHSKAFGPGEGCKAMSGHRYDGGICLLAQCAIVIPPALGNRLVDENILANLHGVIVARIDPKTLGAEHHQRDVLCYGLIKSIKYSGWRSVLLHLRRELDQIAPHDFFNSCGVASCQDQRFD